MITAIRIELLAGHSTGDVYFLSYGREAYKGTVDTDLEPGSYKLIAQKATKKWVIAGTAEAMRFYVELDGADPWALAYSPGLTLQVVVRNVGLDPTEDLLDGIGPDAYKNDPAYIDRVTGGSYDPLTGVFTVTHQDGGVIELDYEAILQQLEKSGPDDRRMATMYVYYRNLRNNKVYPRVFDTKTAPNIVGMVREVQEALPATLSMRQAIKFLLRLLEVRVEIWERPPVLPPRLPAAAAGAWKAVPQGSKFAVREYLGIQGNPPWIRFRRGHDILVARLEVTNDAVLGKEVVYRVSEVMALGPDAAKVRTANRMMLVAAAEEARRHGLQQFKVAGTMVNANGRASMERMAKSLGATVRQSGGVPPNYNYEMILDTARVLVSNE